MARRLTALPFFYFKAAWGGFNTSLFAYGQTGSGKTYTMTGVTGAAANTSLCAV